MIVKCGDTNGYTLHNGDTIVPITNFNTLYEHLTLSIKKYVLNFKVPNAKIYLITCGEILGILKNHLKQASNEIQKNHLH